MRYYCITTVLRTQERAQLNEFCWLCAKYKRSKPLQETTSAADCLTTIHQQFLRNKHIEFLLDCQRNQRMWFSQESNSRYMEEEMISFFVAVFYTTPEDVSRSTLRTFGGHHVVFSEFSANRTSNYGCLKNVILFLWQPAYHDHAHYYTVNLLSLFWLAESVQRSFEISVCEVV